MFEATFQNFPKLFKQIQIFSKLFKTFPNFPKLSTFSKLFKTFQNFSKKSKLFKHYQNLSKLFKTFQKLSKLISIRMGAARWHGSHGIRHITPNRESVGRSQGGRAATGRPTGLFALVAGRARCPAPNHTGSVAIIYIEESIVWIRLVDLLGFFGVRITWCSRVFVWVTRNYKGFQTFSSLLRNLQGFVMICSCMCDFSGDFPEMFLMCSVCVASPMSVQDFIALCKHRQMTFNTSGETEREAQEVTS